MNNYYSILLILTLLFYFFKIYFYQIYKTENYEDIQKKLAPFKKENDKLKKNISTFKKNTEQKKIYKQCINKNSPIGSYKNKIAILFSMYNIDKRNKITNDILKYYVYELNYPRNRIYIVDSSNNGVSETLVPKENQCVFSQDTEFKSINTNNTSILEKLSLLKACNTLNFKDNDYIIKITTKYKISNIRDINPPHGTDFILQKNRRLNWQPSEIFGASKQKFKKLIIDLSKYNDLMESSLYKCTEKKSICKLPLFKNLANYRRSDKKLLKYL